MSDSLPGCISVFVIAVSCTGALTRSNTGKEVLADAKVVVDAVIESSTSAPGVGPISIPLSEPPDVAEAPQEHDFGGGDTVRDYFGGTEDFGDE